MNRGKLSGNAPGIKLREYYGLSPKDIPELKCRDGQFAPPMIMAYLLTIHEGYNSSDGDRKLTVEYKSPGACPEAADIVAELEYESLQDCLKKLVKENLGPKVRSKKMLLLYPICRYAGESLMEQLTKKTPSWTTPPRRCFEEAYIYSKHPCGHDLR